MDVGGADGGGVWMTYREIAAARGIKPEAAVRLVQRRKWPKRERSNDGLAHVLVPPDWIRPADGATPPDVAPRHHPPSSSPDFAGAIQAAIDALREAKDGEITALREQLAEARGLIEELRQGREQAEADRRQADTERRAAETRAYEADQGRDLANTLADEVRNQLESARQQAREAAAAAMGLRNELRAAQIAQAGAEADAAKLRQADAARKSRGRLVRLRSAWRGE
jgi:hypothetical protein